MAGKVAVAVPEGSRALPVAVDKPGHIYPADTVFLLLGAEQYVSRGAYKLLTIMDAFHMDVTDYVCLDAGASTGGVDIVARLLKLKFRNFPIGKILLCMDLCTAVATGIVYGEFNNTLYSVITLVLSSFVLDKVVYGMDYAKVALIISDRYEEIAQAIDTQLDRGVTLLHGQGFYLRSDKFVLLSAVKRKQLAQLKDLVMSIDPSAFIILQDAHQVLGDGFKRYDRNEL